MKKIEQNDIKIIQLLTKNVRISYRQMARKLHLSVATVFNHVKKLEKMGIIKGYRVDLDYERLGYNFHIITEVQVAHGKLFDVEGKLASERGVYAVFDHTGGTDATVIARFKDRKSLDNFVKKIQRYRYVEGTETKLILNTIKEGVLKLA